MFSLHLRTPALTSINSWTGSSSNCKQWPFKSPWRISNFQTVPWNSQVCLLSQNYILAFFSSWKKKKVLKWRITWHVSTKYILKKMILTWESCASEWVCFVWCWMCEKRNCLNCHYIIIYEAVWYWIDFVHFFLVQYHYWVMLVMSSIDMCLITKERLFIFSFMSWTTLFNRPALLLHLSVCTPEM